MWQKQVKRLGSSNWKNTLKLNVSVFEGITTLVCFYIPSQDVHTTKILTWTKWECLNRLCYWALQWLPDMFRTDLGSISTSLSDTCLFSSLSGNASRLSVSISHTLVLCSPHLQPPCMLFLLCEQSLHHSMEIWLGPQWPLQTSAYTSPRCLLSLLWGRRNVQAQAFLILPSLFPNVVLFAS